MDADVDDISGLPRQAFRGALDTTGTRVVRAFWDAIEARDWPAVARLLAPDVTLDWPVSRERISGAANVVAVNAEYPEGWTIRVLRVPLYTVGEAARILDVPTSTFRGWARGYVRRWPTRPDVTERWCNTVASEILVPRDDLIERYPAVAGLTLPEALDELARHFRCGTLVVLQALHRTGVRRFENFTDAYDSEVARLRSLQEGRDSSGGDHYNNRPFRVGERLSRALVADALEGRTSVDEAMRLMSMKSLSNFDEYARRPFRHR